MRDLGDSVLLTVQHTSLKFAFGKRAQQHDVNVLLETDRDICTLTEAGPETPIPDILIPLAREAGYKISRFRGNFLLVHSRIVQARSWSHGSQLVKSTKYVAGPGHDLGFATGSWKHSIEGVGWMGWAAVHMATKGRRPGDPNYRVNEEYEDALERWSNRAGRGKKIAGISGDFNRLMQALPAPLGSEHTSTWVELGKFENTGHDCIDGVFTRDEDKRVSAVRVKAYNDRQKFMFSDHFMVQSDLKIKKLKP